MKTIEVLTLKEMSLVSGGRKDIKDDLDGDGRWGIKTVTTDNKVKVAIRDEDGNRHITKLKL